MKELATKYKDKEEIDMHFHPQAGNALSLAFGNLFYTQLITGLFVFPKIEYSKQRINQSSSISAIVCIFGHFHFWKKKDMELTNLEQPFRNR